VNGIVEDWERGEATDQDRGTQADAFETLDSILADPKAAAAEERAEEIRRSEGTKMR